LSGASRPAAIFAADLVLPISAPQIRDGALLVRDGRIAAVGQLRAIERDNPDVEVRYFPRHATRPRADRSRVG
jgi:imidazolonepropionase-like amidohydrolase